MDHGWKTWITPASLVSSLLTPWSSCYSQPYSILYREHSYSSALEALEAYIEDFNLSQASPCGSMGKICIHGSIPKEIRLSNHYAKEKQDQYDQTKSHLLQSINSLYTIAYTHLQQFVIS
uniref:Uncharacterized protein n=1 Tax=Melopsittacus undulatus TaxID=13146 RepID=A0A8V5GDB1_MELUD